MLRQILRVIRLLGLRRAARMKKRHEQGLKTIRGYAACSSWWALLNCGFLDELEQKGEVLQSEFVRGHACEPEVLAAVVEYLDGIGFLQQQGDRVRLGPDGKVLMAEPRGMVELLWAYEPCFGNLGDLLAGRKKYGRDLTRNITYVGIGSGRLCEQLPYPVMRRMVIEHNRRMVLDLGCGDMAFLRGLCGMDDQIRGHGIDCSQEMVDFCLEQLSRDDCGGRLTAQTGDMFDLPELPTEVQGVDCITACDTFHEYLQQPGRLVELLKGLKERFAGTMFVVGEFCLQDQAWLKKHPTASLEHHLFHQLSNQQIGSASQWREIFAQAEMQIVEEQVYDLIGHGYFMLR